MTVRLLNVNLMHDKQATEKHFKRITDALGFRISLPGFTPLQKYEHLLLKAAL